MSIQEHLAAGARAYSESNAAMTTAAAPTITHPQPTATTIATTR